MFKSLTGSLLFAIIIAACGSSFQHGYNTGVVNAPEKVIENWISSVLERDNNTNVMNMPHLEKRNLIYSTIVFAYCFGGMFGGLLTNIWLRIFGMKRGIIMNNVFVFIAAALMGLSKEKSSIYMLIIGRFIVGLNSGLNGGLVPMYLSEISPTSLRGGVGSVYQLVLTISILIAQLTSTEKVLGNESDWPWLFVVIVIPAFLQILLLPLCADSPRYLQTLKKEEDVKKALIWFRRTEDVQEEMNILKEETERESQTGRPGVYELIANPTLRKPLIISCMVMAAQQLSGINAVIYYSTSTFARAKIENPERGTILMGCMNVAMTIISTLIVDKAGRKTLLCAGFALMCIDAILLAITLKLSMDDNQSMRIASVILVILFVVFFAIGAGSIPWFLVSEIFLSSARPLAMSFAVCINWLMNSFVALTFPALQSLLESYVFLVFAALELFFGLYVLIAIPETKNRNMADIQSEFVTKK